MADQHGGRFKLPWGSSAQRILRREPAAGPADWREVKMTFELTGVDQKTAEALVEKYKAKCPIFRAFNAALKVTVTVKVV